MASADRHLSVAQQHMASGQFAQAEQLLRKLLVVQGRDAEVVMCLAQCLQYQGRSGPAVAMAMRAAELAGNSAGHLALAAWVTRQAEDKAKTVELLERAVEFTGDDLGADADERWRVAVQLCEAYRWCSRPSDALSAAVQARQRWPGNAELLAEEAMARIELDELSAAVDLLRTGAEEHPDSVATAMLLASAGNYDERVDVAEGFTNHLRCGSLVAAGVETDVRAGLVARGGWPEPAGTDAVRPLRVGFLSADLRAHSVAAFMEPLLDQLRAFGDQLSAQCFMTGKMDRVSERLRAICPAWEVLTGQPDASVARAIVRAETDVLVDLNGLTTGERLAVLALRPAPLVVTYLGYPNITGVPGVDARLTDALTDGRDVDGELVAVAKGLGRAGSTEVIERFDGAFVCYRPPADPELAALEVGPLPCAVGAAPVFGSFNHARKLTDATLRLWAGAMGAVPGSRLLIKNQACASPALRLNLLRRLCEAGVAEDRVELVGATATQREHLEMFRRVDVALDTFPYGGTTTTFEALWMGVPVVTLAGRTHASRVGLAIMHRLGRESGQWIAHDPEQFAEICGTLVAERKALAATRATLRERLTGSTWCDERAMAARFVRTIRALWMARCGQRAAGPKG